MPELRQPRREKVKVCRGAESPKMLVKGTTSYRPGSYISTKISLFFQSFLPINSLSISKLKWTPIPCNYRIKTKKNAL